MKQPFLVKLDKNGTRNYTKKMKMVFTLKIPLTRGEKRHIVIFGIDIPKITFYTN